MKEYSRLCYRENTAIERQRKSVYTCFTGFPQKDEVFFVGRGAATARSCRLLSQTAESKVCGDERRILIWKNLKPKIKKIGGKITNKTESNYTATPCRTTLRKIGGREFIVTSYFAGRKNMGKVLSDLAERKAYAEMFDSDFIEESLAKREIKW